MSGECEFINPPYDYSYYDYDYHYDYDYAKEDKDECLQSCLQKSRQSMQATGCFFQQTTGLCIFLKDGKIIGASGKSDAGTCWKIQIGNMLQRVKHPEIKLKSPNKFEHLTRKFFEL